MAKNWRRASHTPKAGGYSLLCCSLDGRGRGFPSGGQIPGIALGFRFETSRPTLPAPALGCNSGSSGRFQGGIRSTFWSIFSTKTRRVSRPGNSPGGIFSQSFSLSVGRIFTVRIPNRVRGQPFFPFMPRWQYLASGSVIFTGHSLRVTAHRRVRVTAGYKWTWRIVRVRAGADGPILRDCAFGTCIWISIVPVRKFHAEGQRSAVRDTAHNSSAALRPTPCRTVRPGLGRSAFQAAFAPAMIVASVDRTGSRRPPGPRPGGRLGRSIYFFLLGPKFAALD